MRRSWHLFRHRSRKNYTFARVELFFQTDVEVVVGGGGGSRDSDASATWKNRFQILLGRVLGGAVDTPEIDGRPSVREHNSMIYRLV